MEENSMDNPFVLLKEKKMQIDQRKQKRKALYAAHSSMVNEVLDLMISAYRPGLWKKGSDASRPYCKRVAWFAGPKLSYWTSYDEHHQIARCIDIVLELDAACRPTGFKVIHHNNNHKCVMVGFSRDELVRGILAVFDCDPAIFTQFQKE
jgi:hypothetical protein